VGLRAIKIGNSPWHVDYEVTTGLCFIKQRFAASSPTDHGIPSVVLGSGIAIVPDVKHSNIG
jgi:hypothetical protein